MSDWSEGIDVSQGNHDTADELFSAIGELDQFFSGQGEFVGQPSFNMPGGNARAPVEDAVISKNESGSWLSKMLDSARSTFGFPDTEKGNTEFGKLAATGGALAVAGLGQGYFAGQKLQQEKELYQQKLDIDRKLAESQASIAEKKMANQDFSKFKFKPPVDANGNPVGLINSVAGITPLSKRVPQ